MQWSAEPKGQKSVDLERGISCTNISASCQQRCGRIIVAKTSCDVERALLCFINIHAHSAPCALQLRHQLLHLLSCASGCSKPQPPLQHSSCVLRQDTRGVKAGGWAGAARRWPSSRHSTPHTHRRVTATSTRHPRPLCPLAGRDERGQRDAKRPLGALVWHPSCSARCQPLTRDHLGGRPKGGQGSQRVGMRCGHPLVGLRACAWAGSPCEGRAGGGGGDGVKTKDTACSESERDQDARWRQRGTAPTPARAEAPPPPQSPPPHTLGCPVAVQRAGVCQDFVGW